jgi:tRNA(fMet)-specific endonuclease VapC
LKLLDSNVLIQGLQGREPTTSRIRSATPMEVGIPSVVVYELEYGTLKAVDRRRRETLEQLLAHVREIPFDSSAALEAARIRIDLERRGLTIGPLDLLIAGTALSRGAVLVTNNIGEFRRIHGLRLEDWSRP